MAYYESVNLNLDSNCLKYDSDGQLTLTYEDEQLTYEQTMNILLGLDPGDRNPAILPFLTYKTKANVDGTTACTLSSYTIPEDGQYMFLAVSGGSANPNSSSTVRGSFTINVVPANGTANYTESADSIFEENRAIVGKGFTVDIKIITLKQNDIVTAAKSGGSLANVSTGIYIMKVDLNNLTGFCDVIESSNTEIYTNATSLLMNAPTLPSIGLFITRAQNANQVKEIIISKGENRSTTTPFDISAINNWGIRVSYFVANLYRGYKITCSITNPVANNVGKILILNL